MNFNKKVLCLGNNTSDTDDQTRRVANKNLAICYGAINELKELDLGYYHSSVYDVEFGTLLDIIKQFDTLIILDQDWNDPDVFRQTVELANLAESIITVEWMNESYKINSLFFKNLVETNKSFCIFPFIELLVQNGSTTVCCRSMKPITQLDKLQEWSTDPEYKKIRDKMLSGELIPDHCQVCYDHETKGIISPRQSGTVQWANRLGLTSINDVLQVKTPAYYEVRASNTCNLQCRMCSPANSNLIEKEYIKIGLHDSRNSTVTYSDFNFINFDNLKSLYVAGGEPSAMPELYEFLEKCIATNNVDFDFTINTNAVKFSSKLKNLFAHFTNLQFIVSIDGYQQVNYYVRWPSDWDTIIENIHYLIKHGHNVILQTVVSIWSISKLHKLLKFIDSEFPGVIMHGLLVQSEADILSPFNFPDAVSIENNLYQIRELNCYQNDLVFKGFIDGLINYFDQPAPIDYQKLKQFFEFNDKLDQSRSIQLKDYIPELEEYRERCYNTV